MIRKRLSILALSALILCCSDNEPTPDEILTKALSNMAGNEFFITEAFDAATAISQDHGTGLLQAGAGRDQFIQELREHAASAFSEVVEDARNDAGWGTVPFFANAATADHMFEEYFAVIPAGIEGPNPGSDVLDMFSHDIDVKLNRDADRVVRLMDRTRSGHDADDMPTETIFFSYGQLAGIKNTIESLINDHDDIVELEVKMTDLLITSYQTGGASVQAFMPLLRLMNPGDFGPQNGYNGFTSVTQGTMTVAQRNDWDKKMRRAALLAAVFALADDFQPGTEDQLSIRLQRAMLEAVTILSWAQQHANK